MRQLDGITESKDMSFEQTPRNSEGQGSLACFSSWDHRARQDLAPEQPPPGSLKGYLKSVLLNHLKMCVWGSRKEFYFSS